MSNWAHVLAWEKQTKESSEVLRRGCKVRKVWKRLTPEDYSKSARRVDDNNQIKFEKAHEPQGEGGDKNKNESKKITNISESSFAQKRTLGTECVETQAARSWIVDWNKRFCKKSGGHARANRKRKSLTLNKMKLPTMKHPAVKIQKSQALRGARLCCTPERVRLVDLEPI